MRQKGKCAVRPAMLLYGLRVLGGEQENRAENERSRDENA